MNTKNNTHTVIKNTDIDKYLSPKDANDLKALIMRLAVAKRCNSGNRKDNRYYICNVDEPYSEEVLKVILKGEQGKTKINEEIKVDELIRKALVEQFENIIEDYDERELSQVDVELNREQLACISECLQFSILKSRVKKTIEELENLKKCYMGKEDAVLKPMSFEDYISAIIDYLKGH